MDYATCYIILRHSYPNGLFTVAVYFSYSLVSGEDEGIRAWQAALHQFEAGIAHIECIVRYMAQVIADDGEIRLVRLQVFELAELLVSAAMRQITTQRVHSVGRIDNDTAILQAPDDLCDQPVIYIVGIYS